MSSVICGNEAHLRRVLLPCRSLCGGLFEVSLGAPA
jgi:hypothetical protein